MTRSLLLVLSLSCLAGCCAEAEFTHPAPTGDPWDTTYLLNADPASVGVAQLTSHAVLLESFRARATVEGVIWVPRRSDKQLPVPDQWTDGGDSAKFTGFALAGAAFRYGRTQDPADFDVLLDSLRGLYILSHATGTPGVICRCAFPASRAADFSYPQDWGHRIQKGFVHTGPDTVADPFRGGTFPAMTYYTRGTKDQLTGILFGLGTTWFVLDQAPPPPGLAAQVQIARQAIATIATDLHAHLLRHGWRIRDEKGENDTNADDVDGLLRAQLMRVLAASTGDANHLAEADEETEDALGAVFEPWINRFNNADQYYAHNLRVARTFTLWLLDPPRRSDLREFSERVWWRYVRDHRSAWFTLVWDVMNGASSSDPALDSLRSLSLKPTRLWSSPLFGQVQEPSYFTALANCTQGLVVAPHLRKPTDYWTWQKEPWDVGDPPQDIDGLLDTTGLSFLVPWEQGRFFGFWP